MSSVGNIFRVFAKFWNTDPTTGVRTLTDPAGTITMRYKDPLGVETNDDYPSSHWIRLAAGSYYYDIATADAQKGWWSGRIFVPGLCSTDFNFEATSTALPT